MCTVYIKSSFILTRKNYGVVKVLYKFLIDLLDLRVQSFSIDIACLFLVLCEDNIIWNTIYLV